MLLEQSQVESYRRDGFLVINGFESADSCAEIRYRAESFVDEFDPHEVRSVFQTDESVRQSDAWFLGSGGEVRCFLEAEAVDAAGNLTRDKYGSVNKIGHALHDKDDAFDRFSRNPDLARVAADIGLTDPLLLQSMYIFKNAFIGGEVTCHQDATFLYTDPVTCTGFWFAIEDATVENGCLWAVPGGHLAEKGAGLRKRFVRNDPADDDAGTSFEVFGPDITTKGAVPLEAPAGTLVVLHGLLPHFSGPNRSAKKRDAYSLHVIDGVADYPASNWLQRPADMPLRGFV
jgi:phytanoyl-CoA hydroxylase